jgi:hypothetical protein
MVAPECLSELSRLPVSNSPGDLAHCVAVVSEQLCSVVHPDTSQVVTEGGSPDL